MTLLVCGDRNWKNEKVIEEILKEQDVDLLIHGNCIGADKIADKIGKKLGFKVKTYPADWSLGKKAGPLRNKKMLDENEIDLVLAFHDNIKESTGTKNMLSQAKKRGIPTLLINSKGGFTEL
jgi:hypothetical protein